MSKAELLYHAQMAAANNLTITAVPSMKPPKPNDIQNDSFQEPLNLSKTSLNNTQPPMNDPVTKSNRLEQTFNDSFISHVTIPTNGNTVNKMMAPPTNGTSGGFRRPRQIFTQEQEDQLAVYVQETSNYYSGLSSKEVRIMAYVYGVCNQVDMPTGWHESHQASFDWCVGFIKRTKLPPTMITGISSKGKTKPTIPNNNGTIALPIPNTSPIKMNDTNAIEID